MSSAAQEKLHRVASSDAGDDERTLYEHSDDESYDGRPSGELSTRDHEILDSEDEREELLTQKDGLKNLLSRRGSGIKVGKWDKKKPRTRRKGGDAESSALMYEMEEGMGASSQSLRSRRSSENDEQRLLTSALQQKVSRILRMRKRS